VEKAIIQYHFFSCPHCYFTLIFSRQFLQVKTILLHGMAPNFHTFQKVNFGLPEHLGHLTTNILKM